MRRLIAACTSRGSVPLCSARISRRSRSGTTLFSAVSRRCRIVIPACGGGGGGSAAASSSAAGTSHALFIARSDDGGQRPRRQRFETQEPIEQNLRRDPGPAGGETVAEFREQLVLAERSLG